jgi:S-adenosylmethionine hydrolase
MRPVLFLTDFGYEDEFAGVCRAVIDRLAPQVKVIDLAHGIGPGDIRRGALALAAAVPYSAPAVWLAVVDPGVGTARRAVAVRAGEHLLVGPDNGLLWPAIEAAGGADSAWEISQSRARLEGARRTFHGRDVFSPVAACLARGDDPGGLGSPIEVTGLIPLELPEARISDGRIEATVLAADRYGNLFLNVSAEQAEATSLRPDSPVSVETASGHRQTVAFARAFGEVEEGAALIYPDSSGSLSLAVNRGDASAAFGLLPDDEVTLKAT